VPPLSRRTGAAKARGLALPMLTTYTSGAAPVNTNPPQGWGREIRKTALSLGERVACCRRFHQSVSRRTGRVRGHVGGRSSLFLRYCRLCATLFRSQVSVEKGGNLL
jgi:hypothetical protein